MKWQTVHEAQPSDLIEADCDYLAGEIEMSDDEIVIKITEQTNVAIALRIMAQCFGRFSVHDDFQPYAQCRVEHLNKMSGLFAAHALRLLVTHRLAVARWMDARLPEPKWVAIVQ